MANDPHKRETVTRRDPAQHHRLAVPGDTELSPIPTALVWMTDGDATVVDVDGEALTYSFTAGQILPLRPRKITAATASIAVIW